MVKPSLYLFMKSFAELLTIYFILTVFLIPVRLEGKPFSLLAGDIQSQPVHDTTGLTRYINVMPFNLAILPPSSGVQFYKDGLLFLSNTKFEGKMLPKHVSFGSNEAYSAILKDTSLGFHIIFSPASPFSYPCEATTFSPDYKTMYYTRITKKEKKEKIYQAVYNTDGRDYVEWATNDVPLNFCTGDYIYTHPALSADGSMMIFSSDKPGTYGEVDLFVTKKEGDKWSSPVNLGIDINTSQNECYPFLDADNNLYYSSDGLPGFGGYDIFTCRYNGKSWDKPINLSAKINSVSDNIAFTIDRSDERRAFYTSRSGSGSGGMQLYMVTLSEKNINGTPLSISYIYNGKPEAEEPVSAKKQVAAAVLPAEVQAAGEVKEKKIGEVKKPEATPQKPQSGKYVTIKSNTALPDDLKDIVVYRVQFLTTSRPRQEDQIIINGVTYKTYEYFYLNAYRYTIGEFRTLGPARQLQNIVRKAGYPGAFVAAFKNDMRSLDFDLFK
jgi:hypothetical protein